MLLNVADVYDYKTRLYDPDLGRFQYTGQIFLAEAGLYHYKARAYHPGLGRFLQTDPIDTADGLNMYAYVGNDPVNATDPSGLSRIIPCSENPNCVSIQFNSSSGGGSSEGGRSGGGPTPNVCIDGACTPQTVFVPGSSSGSDFGDQIVVSATRSRTYEFWQTGTYRIWNTFGGGDFSGFRGQACFNEQCSDGINDLTLDMVLLAAGGPISRGLGFFARAIGARAGSSTLRAASEAAFKAADRAGTFTVGAKHLAGAGGKWGKFALGANPNALLREALISPNARFFPNDANSFRVVTDLGRVIGTKGETGVRVVVDFTGHVVTWFPVRP